MFLLLAASLAIMFLQLFWVFLIKLICQILDSIKGKTVTHVIYLLSWISEIGFYCLNRTKKNEIRERKRESFIKRKESPIDPEKVHRFLQVNYINWPELTWAVSWISIQSSSSDLGINEIRSTKKEKKKRSWKSEEHAAKWMKEANRFIWEDSHGRQVVERINEI